MHAHDRFLPEWFNRIRSRQITLPRFQRPGVAEKMLKALLSDLGITFHKTHELGASMDSPARSGAPLPSEFENLDVLTPFGAVYRYDDYDGTESLNRAETRALLRSLRAWVEDRLHSRTILEAT